MDVESQMQKVLEGEVKLGKEYVKDKTEKHLLHFLDQEDKKEEQKMTHDLKMLHLRSWKEKYVL